MAEDFMLIHHHHPVDLVAMGDGKEDRRLQDNAKEDSDVEQEPERLQYKVETGQSVERFF